MPAKLDPQSSLEDSPFNERAAATGDLGGGSDLVARYRERRFSFLNLPDQMLGDPIDWTAAPQGDRLWLYNLHYGEWALPLAQAAAASPRREPCRLLIDLLADWMDHNRPGSRPGWEPYPLSRRLAAWARLPFILAGNPRWQSFWSDRFEPSLRQQARFLRHNVEHDVPNNHLIANYRALAWVGLLFQNWPESSALAGQGLENLWDNARRQVLSDGGHEERSISYHAIVLQDLLETWLLARRRRVDTPADLVDLLTGMLSFLAATRTPDGGWPMLNDTVPGYPMDPGQLLLAGAGILERPEWTIGLKGTRGAYTRWLGAPPIQPDSAQGHPVDRVSIFAQTGYAVLRNGDTFIVFDAGPMGPERLPGHGHADALSFELHAAGQQLIVDPGVYTYSAGAWRDHFRATSAHNTVTVDGLDQCVFWGAFRVADPPAGRLISWTSEHVAGEHDGYQRLSEPLRHRRRLALSGPEHLEIVDEFAGQGEHRFDLTFQFSARAQAQAESRQAVIHWPDGPRLRITPIDFDPSATARIARGWVSRGWNLKQEAPKFVLSWSARAPMTNRVRLLIER